MFRLRHSRKPVSVSNASIPTATPAPIPAFAPSVSVPLLEGVGAGGLEVTAGKAAVAVAGVVVTVANVEASVALPRGVAEAEAEPSLAMLDRDCTAVPSHVSLLGFAHDQVPPMEAEVSQQALSKGSAMPHHY